ncbi:MAG: type II secretion system protein GspM [Thermodesulfobacteriota bacterium]|nr:MAG: type II secretion system protein GspM [Thermodesulfobacteriota bacterium]
MRGGDGLRSRAGKVPSAVYLLAAALVAFLAAGSVSEYYSGMKEEARLKSGELVVWADLVDRADELEELVEKKTEELQKLEEGLLPGTTPSLGAAHLQGAFRDHSARSGIRISSERALKTVDRGRYVGVPVEFRFRAGISELKELLSDMKGSSPAMGVRSVRIRSRGEREPGRLDVTLVVEGVIRKVELAS